MLDHRLLATADADGQHRPFTPADALADKLIREQLEAQYPGLFAMIDSCNEAYNEAANQNKKRVEEWKEKLTKA